VESWCTDESVRRRNIRGSISRSSDTAIPWGVARFRQIGSRSYMGTGGRHLLARRCYCPSGRRWIPKSRDQAKRWEEEQERRIAASKPSAVVELAAKEDTPLDMCFACFNLGSNTFYIDRMVVTTSDGARHESGLTPQIVIPGTWVTIDYNPAELLGMFGENQPFKEANCMLFLRGATGIVTTDPEWFYVGYGNGRADWHKGRLADRQPGVIPPQHKIIREPKQSQ
jgi:hypothetical protein